MGRRKMEEEGTRTIHSMRLGGFLSFPPWAPEFAMLGKNILIGANCTGKTNLIEAFELLSAAPGDLAARVEAGGGPEWWRWQGAGMDGSSPTVEVVLDGDDNPAGRPLRYRLAFDAVAGRTEVVEEVVEEAEPRDGEEAARFHYRFREGRGLLGVRDGRKRSMLEVANGELDPGQSVLAQRKDADRYPELTWVGERLGAIRSFRGWSFGLDATLRRPGVDDPSADVLAQDVRNLASILDRLQAEDERRVTDVLRHFFLRCEGLSTEAANGAVQVCMRETDFPRAIPPVRLSDGALRFLALLAILLSPEPPSVLCIDEPELGLHRRAIFLLNFVVDLAAESRQLVIATHSDSFLDQHGSEPESVVAFDRLAGATVLERLDRDELRPALEKHLLGELWLMNQIGGN